MTNLKYALVFASLLSISNHAIAKWVDSQLVPTGSPLTIYIEEGSWRQVGSNVTLIILTDLKSPENFKGKLGRSIKTQYEFNCKGKYRTLSDTAYSNNLGQGGIVDSRGAKNIWQNVGEGNPIAALSQMGCELRK